MHLSSRSWQCSVLAAEGTTWLGAMLSSHPVAMGMPRPEAGEDGKRGAPTVGKTMPLYSQRRQRLYFRMHHAALTPSFQPIFFPSEYVRPA